MSFFTQWLHKQGQEIVTQPLSHPVDGMQDDYIRTEGLSKLGWRVVRRKIYLFFSGQKNLMQKKADTRWKKRIVDLLQNSSNWRLTDGFSGKRFF
jgi:hypothetical protein